MHALFSLSGPGIDISHHNVDGRGAPIDWNQALASGFTFAFIKASDGDSFKDPRFVESATSAHAAGVKIGAYHFLRPGSQAVDQAASFLRQIEAAGGASAFELGAALDVEDPDDAPGSWDALAQVQRIAKVSHFLDQVEQVFSARPLIYCIPEWWAQAFGLAGDFSGHPLWAASPGRTPNLTGTTWADWAIWQYSFFGTVPGVGFKSVDLDRPGSAGASSGT